MHKIGDIVVVSGEEGEPLPGVVVSVYPPSTTINRGLWLSVAFFKPQFEAVCLGGNTHIHLPSGVS